MQSWETGLCGCCDVKDCGCGCCCKTYCCSECIWGSAMETAGIGSCIGDCLCKPPPHRALRSWISLSARARAVMTLCPCIALPCRRADVAKKYNIEESCPSTWCMGCCCCLCTYYQVTNQILVKENATWGCGNVLIGHGAPETAKMER